MSIKQRIARVFWTLVLLLGIWMFIVGVEIAVLLLSRTWTPR
jgi:hypothetical protein